jgi:hypothetical protein
MNSFQSLLNSYSKLRKRTYKFNTISEDQKVPSTSGMRQKEGKEGGIPNKARSRIQLQFGSIGTYSPFIPKFLTSFLQPQPQKPEQPIGGDVWVNGANLNFFGEAGQGTGSLPNTQEWVDWIIEFLQKGGKVHGDATDAVAEDEATSEGVHSEKSVYSEKQWEAARNIREIKAQLASMEDQIPNPESMDTFASLASMQAYSEGHPLHTVTSQFQLLMQALTNSDQISQEEMDEALVEMQADTKELLKFLKDNKEALESGECIPPSPEVKKLSERFFISKLRPGGKVVLSYGNLGGDSQNPSKMSGLMERLGEGNSDEKTQAAWAKSQTNNEKDGRSTSTFLGQGNDKAVAIAPQSESNKAHESTSSIFQLVDKYKNVKICAAEGEPAEDLFKVSSADPATQLQSRISEKATGIVDLWRRRNLLKKGSKEQKRVDEKIQEAMIELQNAADQDCEALKNLIKISKEYKKVAGSYAPGTPVAIAEMESMLTEAGTDQDICGTGTGFKDTVMAIVAREHGNPLHQALSEIEFEGEVTISDTLPDCGNGTSPVNLKTGRQDGGNGLNPAIEEPTRVVADNVLLCDNREDALRIYNKLGMKTNTKSAKMSLNNPCIDPITKKEIYILPISNKMYRAAGFMSQGKLVKEGAYADVEYIEQTADRLFEGHENAGEIKKESVKEAAAWLKEHKLAQIQLLDMKLAREGASKDTIDKIKHTDRHILTLEIKKELERTDLLPNSKERIDLEELQKDIKDFDKEHSKDPTSKAAITKAASLGHRIADMRRGIARRGMSATERQHSEAAQIVLDNLAATGSSNAFLIPSSHDTPAGLFICEDDIRRCIARRVQEAWDPSKFKKLFNNPHDDGLKAKNRVTNMKSGQIQHALETKVDVAKLHKMLARIDEAEATGQ